MDRERMELSLKYLFHFRRLLTQLDAAKTRKSPEGKSPAKGLDKDGGLVTYELHCRPEQNKFSQAAKVIGCTSVIKL